MAEQKKEENKERCCDDASWLLQSFFGRGLADALLRRLLLCSAEPLNMQITGYIIITSKTILIDLFGKFHCWYFQFISFL